jgi:hypothetical protein
MADRIGAGGVVIKTPVAKEIVKVKPKADTPKESSVKTENSWSKK